MQPQESQTRTTGPLTHPEASEWIAFLYGETALKKRRELEKHLTHCPECSAQVKTWRASRTALDHWQLPAMPKPSPATRFSLHTWGQAMKWAAAVVIVLSLGFAFGRQTSPNRAELAVLKKSVAQLADSVRRERDMSQSNHVNIAMAAAKTEALRVLSEYSQLQESLRAADQQNLAVTLRNLETRLGRLRAELETVALNTENGFEQTHENLARLVSFSAPSGK